MNRHHLFLIDSHSLIYRAYFAIRGLSTSKGLPTNAIYGFTNMLLRVIREKQPDYMTMVFDTKGPTRRHAEYGAYKAQRPEMPDALKQQIPFIHRIVSAFRIPTLMMEGYEADDLIGTLAKRAEQKGLDVTIVTGDKDLFQLISPSIKIYDGMKDKTYTAQDVHERFGVEPARIVEIMGLMGDTIDNIPGVPGIGEKTAVKLIQQFETIDNLFEHLDQISRPKLRETLHRHIELARMSRQLSTLQLDCPVEMVPLHLERKSPNLQELINLFQELEFTSLLKRLKEIQDTVDNSQLPSPSLITDQEALTALIRQARKAQEVIIEPWPITSYSQPWVGVAISLPSSASGGSGGEGFYIPIKHRCSGVPPQIEEKAVMEHLNRLLSDASVKKLGHGLKALTLGCWSRGLLVEGPALDTSMASHQRPLAVRSCQGLAFDAGIASYLLNPNRRDHSLETSALEYLGHPLNRLPQDNNPDEVPVETVAALLAERGRSIFKLSKHLMPLLSEQQLVSLFEEIEMPLIAVLAEMEQNGIKLDRKDLAEYSKELKEQLGSMIQRIHTLAGGEFNINSPKQLSEVLFERLGLKPIKRTKTGYSTNEEVLQQLTLQHALPAEILNYRQLAKLKSTYVDALPQLVNLQTGRLHSSFNQTATATGRLSSSEPNLQNIPIKGDRGERIRKAFIAEEGYRLISFDYNQVELRILAHLSGDEKLASDFREGNDIHTSTAMKIFGLPADHISPEMRRTAKTVNFGIVYGISAYGLSTTLGIPQNEAKRYIDSYFSYYQGVRQFIERAIQQAQDRGYVTTLLLRRRPIPELASQDRTTRALGERTAVNTVIQGSAADLIKLAMIRIAARIRKEALGSRMLLQIHDELVFEVPEVEIETMKSLVKEEMEGVKVLSVPLKVDIGVGQDWSEAHA